MWFSKAPVAPQSMASSLLKGSRYTRTFEPSPRQSIVHASTSGNEKGRTVRVRDTENKFPSTSKPLKRSASDELSGRASRDGTETVAVTLKPTEADVEILTPSVDTPSDNFIWKYWDTLPGRYKMLFAMSMSFIVCNMDKVNISVAIIPMAQDFGWSPTIAGLVQSSFFWGYMLSQIPGGYVASQLGGRTVLPAGVGLWSAATAGVPLLAGTIPGLCISRAAVGLGEGVAPSAAMDMVARTIDNSERSRATSFIFGGLHIGSLLGLLVAPPLIENFGWQSVFYLFGGIGLVWCLYWERLIGSIAASDPELVVALNSNGHLSEAQQKESVPWRAFMRTPAFWALAFTHFCNNWFHYTMMAWLPTYFTDTLSLDLTHAAQLSLIPPIAALIVSTIAGTSADALIGRGVPVKVVRKLAQCTAFLGPAACLTAASFAHDGTTAVGLITLSLGLASFSLAGLYCNHADLSPRYAPVLLGMTNTAGAVPGIIGVAATGAILDQTDSWALALFAPSVFLFLAGSAVFTAFGRTDRQDFSNNTPFEFEEKLGLSRVWSFFGAMGSKVGDLKKKN